MNDPRLLPQRLRPGVWWALTLLLLSLPGRVAGAVVINEIHYAPADKTRPIEFIELWNVGDRPVDLSGWRLADAVQYTFPPETTLPAQGFVVVAGTLSAFQSAYGFAPLGPWTGRLSRGGAQVELRDRQGTRVDVVSYRPGFPWPSRAHGEGSSMELIHPTLDNDLGGSWRSSGTSGGSANPTPGAVNGVFADNAPPQIRQVNHSPIQPTGGMPELITAKITDPDGVPQVTLTYQAVAPGRYLRKTDAAYRTNWTPVPMRDDGTGGDLVADDGVFSVTLPPEVQIHRRLIRYRIVATDSGGRSIQVPYADDPQPNFAYFVYDGIPGWSGAFKPGDPGPQGTLQNFPAPLLNSMPAYHLIAHQTDVINSQYNGGFDTVPMWGTLVYEGKVYDHITFNNRGEFSTYVSGKNKWRVHVNNTHEFQAKDNYGRPYAETWDDFNLNGGSSPWIAANRGMCGIEECISFRVYELLGVPSPRTHYVSFRVIDSAIEAANPIATVQDATFPGAGKGQYSGDFWGLYLVTESPDGSFLDERGLPDGSLYKIEGGGNGTGDKKNQGPTHPSSNADWSTFAAASARSQSVAWWRTNLDLPTYYSFRLACRIVGNVDLRNGWNHFFYHHPDGRWMPIPWDLDMMFVGRTHQSASGAITQDGCLSQPALAIEKRNRAREVLDLLLSDTRPDGGQVGQLVDEYAQIVNPSGQPQTWANIDSAMWNFHPRTAGSPNAHTDSNHKGNFYYSPHTFNAIGGSYKRWLRAPNYVGFGVFDDFVRYLTDYMTDTYPGPKAWTVGNGNQLGYGFEFVRNEAKEAVAADVPERPTITYIGSAGFPVNDLQFKSSGYVGKQFAAMQWRLGWISAPGLAGFVPGQPRRYEVEPYWTSEEIRLSDPQIRVPLTATKPGQTYRARVRHKDANGRWSRWSEPVQFVSRAPDVTALKDSLVLSEIMYHPRAATAGELALGFADEEFEFLELKNTASTAIDLTNVGFSTGVNFNFAPGTTLGAGAYGLVVKNRAAFESRYGTNHLIFGDYGGDSLRNSGERITLAYGSNTPIRSVAYLDAHPWPTEADGTGRSLELISPNSRPDPDVPENWRASGSPMGTPGGSDGLTFVQWGAARGGITDAAGDLDGDGLSNLLEYALVGDPWVPSTLPQPVARMLDVTLDEVSGPYLTVTFRGRMDAADLGYFVELSEDLTTWTAGAVRVSVQSQGDGTAISVWRLPEPVQSGGARFVRVRVTW